MDELIVRYLEGDVSELEARRLERWRREAPENEREYRQVVRLVEQIRALREPPVPARPALSLIITEAESRRRKGTRRAFGRAALTSRWVPSGLAAAAIVAMVFMAVRDGGGPEVVGTALAAIQSSTGPGDVMTMSLSDGTVVRVAPETRLDFPPATGRREVVLEGKAFFAVAEDELPFVVRTRMGDVTVTGTRFEVLVGEELRLVVLEGVVRLGGTAGGSEVRAGQVAWLTEGSSPRVVDRENVWTLLDWSGGLMVFQATPLSQVALEMSRHFGRDVRVLDEELASRRITAWFEDEPLEEVVSAVCLVAGAKCAVNESEVTIGR